MIGFIEDRSVVETFDLGKATKTDVSYTPNWLIKPCGHTYGFGGKLATFSKKGLDYI